MDAASVISRFAYREYGQNIFVDPPQFDEKSNLYYSNIRSKIPVFIYDDRHAADYKVRVLKIDSLGSVYLNDKLKLVTKLTTFRDKCYENLDDLLKIWRQRIENIVVTSSSDQFAKIDAFTNHFGKIELIIENLIESGEIKNTDLEKGISDRGKIIRYLDLLEGLQLARKVENGYLPGNNLINLQAKCETPKELWTAVLSHVIRERYLSLKKVFGINILEKVISIDNVIYSPEIELKEAVHRRKESIAKGFKHHYQKNINPLHLIRGLKRLEKVGAIRREGSNYFGEEALREEMIRRRENVPPLVISPLVG